MFTTCAYCLKQIEPRKLGESHDESHGLCHVCYVREMAEIDRMFPEKSEQDPKALNE